MDHPNTADGRCDNVVFILIFGNSLEAISLTKFI